MPQTAVLWCQPQGCLHGCVRCCACAGGSRRTGKPSRAESFKAKANEAFKRGDFDGAIAGYSGAIQADPHNPVYFSNRAMAYLKVSPITFFIITIFFFFIFFTSFSR